MQGAAAALLAWKHEIENEVNAVCIALVHDRMWTAVIDLDNLPGQQITCLFANAEQHFVVSLDRYMNPMRMT